MTAPLQKHTHTEKKKRKGLGGALCALATSSAFCIKVITANEKSPSRVVYVNDEMRTVTAALPGPV